MFRVGVVVFVASVGACSAPARRETPPTTTPPPDAAGPADASPDAAPEFVTEADYELPIAGPVLSGCHPARTAKPPAATLKRKTYDFSSVKMRPLRHGPTISERPYIGYDRTLETARSVFYDRSASVTECWRWASARGAKETTLAVELTLDPRGSTSGLSITSAQTGDDDLIKCVTDMLAPPHWGAPRAHATRVHTFLAFNNDMAPPPKPPARPKPPSSKPPKPALPACAPATPPPDDDVFLPLLVVTNYDDARATDGLVMPRRRCMPYRSRDVDKAMIRISIRSQQGALDACYADALARTPSLAGDLGAKLLLDAAGYARDVEVAGAGDKALHACVAAALDALWVVPSVPSQEVEVNLAIQLLPTLTTSADPKVLLEAGNPEAALAEWVNVLRSPHVPFQGCLAHAGILEAMAVVAPWLDDDRVRIAFENLARSALALPVEQGRFCIAKVEGLLKSYVRIQDPGAPVTAARHLERYEAALPFAPFLESGSSLRWYHAFWLLRTDRASEGEDLLAELARDPIIGTKVTDWLDKRAKQPQMLHDHCDRIF